MADDSRVDELLEQLLESGGTPEEVCRTCPELIEQVRAGWQEVRALKAEVGAWFPETPAEDDPGPEGVKAAAQPAAELPRVRSYELEGVLGRGGGRLPGAARAAQSPRGPEDAAGRRLRRATGAEALPARGGSDRRPPNIVHRDLKPGNILLKRDEPGRMKDDKNRPDSSFLLPAIPVSRGAGGRP
jgi:Phosphotransferase enzyme family